MKKLYLILFLNVFIFANEQEDFLKTLNEVSEIATKTKLNVDKTPSSVEVIKRDFIVKSGARTLLDILQYLPGVEISMSASGKKQIIVRGNKSTYRDKIKFLINGREVTNNLYSNQFYYYNFPASLIKRIEFTKTPDAVLYGDHAYLGVINIITLNSLNKNMINFYQSSKKQTSFATFQKTKHFLIDGYYSISNPDTKKVTTLLVDFKNHTQTPFRRNKADEEEKNAGVGIRYKKNNSKISYRINYYQKANFFGVVNLPPLSRDKHINFLHQYLNYNYSKFLTPDIQNSFNIGVKNYIWRGFFRVAPYDLNASSGSDKDLIEGAKINEMEYYIKNRTTYNLQKHTINILFDTKYAKLYNRRYIQYVPALNNKISKDLLNGNVALGLISIGAEDLYIIKDNFSIIYGGRYSHYSDFGNDFSYKIGSVYNLNKSTTFKLLFNTAFRAPSWVELYAKSAASFNGNPDLKAEKIKMLEFIYLQKIFKNDKLQTILYTGKETNYIGRNLSSTGKKIYQNMGDYLVRGIEVNYKKVYKKGYFDISYSHNANKALFSAKIDTIDYYQYLGIRKNLYKGYNIYNFSDKLSLFSGVIYGSKINMPVVNDINPYFSLNMNLNYHKRNNSIIFGVNNLTNHSNSYVSMPSDLINNQYMFIQDDGRLPDIGRVFYINFTKKW